jgi:peroxiredoxin
MSRLLALVLGLFCVAAASAIEVGEPAPELKARLADGAEFSLAAHRGEVVILDFWACWCAPCLQELEALKTLHQKYGPRGLTVLAINTDDPEDLAKARKIAAGFPFPSASAADVQAPGFGRIWRLPITFVIDRAGVLRHDGGAGPRHAYDLPALEAMVEPLLAAPPVTAQAQKP